jgi:YHS domain-containing protein
MVTLDGLNAKYGVIERERIKTMKTTVKILCILAVLGLMWSGCEKSSNDTPAPPESGTQTTTASDTTTKAQEKCPIMGNKVDKAVFTDYEGERVYFCCPGCIDKFNDEPVKFVKAMKDDGVILDKTP